MAGGTQAGKTTLLNTLVNAIPARERVITCEEVFELRPNLPDVVAMQTRQPNLEGHGEIRLRRLVKEALRMRPSRIIVGEVRQEESLDLLIALTPACPGCARVHANSAREAVVKLCTLPLLAGENVTDGVRRADRRGLRRPRRARWASMPDGPAGSARSLRVPGRVEGGVVETADIFASRDGRLVRAEGYPPHAERFERHGFDLPGLLAGGRDRDAAV